MTKPTRAARRALRPVELPVTKTLTGAAGTDSRSSHQPLKRAVDRELWRILGEIAAGEDRLLDDLEARMNALENP